MSSSFVPFVPAAKTAPRSAAPPAFAPVVAAPVAAPVHSPSVASSPVAAPEPRSIPAPAEPCTPKVTVQRDAERITRIQIHCSCGELIELDCQY